MTDDELLETCKQKPGDIIVVPPEPDLIGLRDHFAGLAMQSIIEMRKGDVSDLVIARVAFEMADAMMQERARRLSTDSPPAQPPTETQSRPI